MLSLCGIALACIVAEPAVGADVGGPFGAAPLPDAHGWAGCYLGAEGGGAWGMSRHDAINAGALSGDAITYDFGMTGSVFGGTLGCNYQTGIFVLGIEDDMSWTDKSGSAFDVPPFDPFVLSSTNENWIDTLRTRAGIARDQWLGYVTGGAAFAGTNVSVCNTLGCVNGSGTRVGWTIGAGVEYAVIDNWTLKVEYLYADFGTARYIGSATALPGGVTVVPRDVSLTDSIARVGVNYKFSFALPR